MSKSIFRVPTGHATSHYFSHARASHGMPFHIFIFISLFYLMLRFHLLEMRYVSELRLSCCLKEFSLNTVMHEPWAYHHWGFQREETRPLRHFHHASFSFSFSHERRHTEFTRGHWDIYWRHEFSLETHADDAIIFMLRKSFSLEKESIRQLSYFLFMLFIHIFIELRRERMQVFLLYFSLPLRERRLLVLQHWKLCCREAFIYHWLLRIYYIIETRLFERLYMTFIWERYINITQEGGGWWWLYGTAEFSFAIFIFFIFETLHKTHHYHFQRRRIPLPPPLFVVNNSFSACHLLAFSSSSPSRACSSWPWISIHTELFSFFHRIVRSLLLSSFLFSYIACHFLLSLSLWHGIPHHLPLACFSS